MSQDGGLKEVEAQTLQRLQTLYHSETAWLAIQVVVVGRPVGQQVQIDAGRGCYPVLGLS